MKNFRKKTKTLNRHNAIIAIMFIVFGAIVARLLYLQVFRYDDFKEKANTRSRRFLSEQAPRGKIYDSNGNVLATNKQTYTITFTETDESKSEFYNTMDKVFTLLKQSGDKVQDKMQLKIDENNELYFDFNVEKQEDKNALEIRFKKDRGLDEEVKKKLFPNQEGDLTAEQEEKIDIELLKYTPQETFDYLVKSYKMYELILKDYDKDTKEKEAKKYSTMNASEITKEISKSYTINQIRDYMIVKDAIKMQSFSGFKPVTIASNISQDTAFIFQQKLNDMSGVDVSLEPIRYYPYGELASSVLGYVSSINGENKTKYEERGYDVSTDLIGKAGLESSFESILRGTKGGSTIQVNSAGRKTSELFNLETYPGKNIHTTIDKDIQYSAETMLKYQLNYMQNQYIGDFNSKNTTRGAAIAIEVDTGRILGLVSEPGYDPNLFAQGEISTEVSEKYFTPDLEKFGNEFIKKMGLNISIDDLFPKNKYGQREDTYDIYPKPFYNYATMGLIAPGSTFKPVTAIAGLSEGVITSDETMQDALYFDKYPEIFGTTRPKDNAVHGIVDVKKAIEVSCNYYFYDTAIRMYKKNGSDIDALNTIAKYAWKLGLGVDNTSNQPKTTGIEISENFGQTYNFEDFKQLKIFYSRWDLVTALEQGNFPSTGVKFVPVDIAVNESDSEALAAAKNELKTAVEDKLNEIGIKDIRTEAEFNSFYEQTKVILEKIYNNSDKYKQNIQDSNKSKDSAIDQVAYQIANWVVYSMSLEITSPVEIANAAIGQGMNNFTPLQMVNYIATVVNGGNRYKAHLVDKITDSEGNIVEEFKPEILDHVDISDEILNDIKVGMNRVNEGPQGTARATFSGFPIHTAGKTGTATFRADQEKYGRTDYATYISFAPLDKPKIAVVVVMYDGGHGGLGAPVARAIYETYFRNEIKANYPGYTPSYMGGGTYDFTLNPPTADIKDDGIVTEEDKLKDLENENKNKNKNSSGSQTPVTQPDIVD